MTEKLQVIHIQTDDRRNHYLEMVECPKIKDKVLSRKCKSCKHCRIYMGDFVKCSYLSDTYKLEHPVVISVKI